tara:strand:- start:568 stop:723 length:156 start_codon:yes stop_codon:yes gene_type:complete
MSELNEKATLVERIYWYMNINDVTKAKALATLGDYLEECYAWDVDFNSPMF